MSLEAKLKLSGLAMLALMMIVPFQNCAPASPLAPGSSSSLQDSAGLVNAASAGAAGLPVTVIDNVNATTAVSFNQPGYAAPESAAQVAMDGACSQLQNGATLRWTLRDPVTGHQLATDVMPCSQGAFRVEFDLAALPTCGQEYEVVAQLGLGQAGHATIQKICGL